MYKGVCMGVALLILPYFSLISHGNENHFIFIGYLKTGGGGEGVRATALDPSGSATVGT